MARGTQAHGTKPTVTIWQRSVRQWWLRRKTHAGTVIKHITFAALLPALAAIPMSSPAQQVRFDARGTTAFEAAPTPADGASLHGLRFDDPATPLGRYALLLDELPGQPLTLTDARARLAAGQFHRSVAAVPNHGNLAPPVWMYLDIANDAAVPLAYRIYVAEGWTDRVDAWLASADGTARHWQGGDARSPSRFLRIGLGFGFDALLPPGRSGLFVRADSIDSAALDLRLVPLADTGQLEGAAQHWLGLVHGFLLALVVAYGLLWMALREATLLRYVAYVASYLAMHLAYSGIGATLGWPDSAVVARFAILLGMALFSSAGLWFARDFLALSLWAPRLDRAIAWLVRFALAAMATCVLFDSPAMAVRIAFAYIMLFTVLMVVLGARAAWHRRTQARTFLAASLASMAGAFITTLAVMGRIPFSATTFRAVEIGVMVEASIWALALGLRLRRDRASHVQALQLAEHDPLTGLCNRRGFLARARPIHAASAQDGTTLGLVLIDIDHFKWINDRHGHDAGDRTLVAVADLLRAMARDEDVVARWGGEEFLFLLPGVPLDTAIAFAEQLRVALAGILVTLANDNAVTMTASLGVAASAPGVTLEGVLRQADIALYGAKQAGRDRVGLPRETAAAQPCPVHASN